MKARNVYSFDPAFAKPNFGFNALGGFSGGALRATDRRGCDEAHRRPSNSVAGGATRGMARPGFSQVQGDRSGRIASRTAEEH